MNTGYLIYQAERPRSRAEQRQVDIAHAEIARKVSRGWQALSAPLRALHSAGRAAQRAARRPAELPADPNHRPARARLAALEGRLGGFGRS